MVAALKEPRAAVHAQLSYIAEDAELASLMWQIAALPDEARLVIKMMVNYLGERNAAAG